MCFVRRCLEEKEESGELPQLPDALLLLESPRLTHVSGNDHASVVAAAMAESALRKREFNGKSSSLPRRSKLPKGNLPHSKNSPDTLGNVLVPPQLKGRLVREIGLVSSQYFTLLYLNKHIKIMAYMYLQE